MAATAALQLLCRPSLSAAQLRQVHAQLLTSSSLLLADRFLPNQLLRSLHPLGTLRLFPRLRRILPAFRPNNYAFSFLLKASADSTGSDARLVSSLHALAVDMLRSGARPNRAAVVGVLTACGALGALEQGRWVHALVAARPSQVGMDGVVATALVDMYAKCGSLDAARQVFAAATPEQRDVFAYTAMISGLSDHGRCQEAMELFGKMQAEGVRPNEVTFICVLTACGRAGLVGRAKEIFRSMAAEHGVQPGVEHYGCLVDVLGRAGRLREALAVVRSMPMRPDSYVLGALLSACAAQGDVDVGKQVVEWLVEQGLDHSGVHVQLSNMYAAWSEWEEVARVRRAMDQRNVAKVPGCSMLEVDGVACEFVAGDRSHPRMREIMAAVTDLHEHLRLLGTTALEDAWAFLL
ncbi:hypothetical protein C2845_PM12G31720 [Panicum miliaceum]|uniref:Pentatricopeptide repeat-containing protein n=1 Tax=Panicum miliaceum TaxID=4540 RepID=A0A3L6QID7_PANMI|nr:hypothetical protein C2845_PM12G31720 [Panicum miliaceum]